MADPKVVIEGEAKHRDGKKVTYFTPSWAGKF
jgi:hypothetical protein